MTIISYYYKSMHFHGVDNDAKTIFMINLIIIFSLSLMPI